MKIRFDTPVITIRVGMSMQHEHKALSYNMPQVLLVIRLVLNLCQQISGLGQIVFTNLWNISQNNSHMLPKSTIHFMQQSKTERTS